MSTLAARLFAALVTVVACTTALRGAEPPPQRLQPADLEYAGAFRLPDASGGSSWEWCGEALAYHPGGDPQGPGDGCPGSLFGVGNDPQAWVSEITIPAPVLSRAKKAEELPTARTLQPFRDIRGGAWRDYEMYRCGLAVLPKGPGHTTEKLFFCWGQHMQEDATEATHGWRGLDLSAPQMAGPWRIATFRNYMTCQYLVEIPRTWSDTHTPGMRLATGRFRDGGQGGKGPSLIAFAVPAEDKPPPAGAALDAKPLILYGTVYDENSPAMQDYHASDEWAGGAWLTAGAKAAVIFVGTKGLGERCWYGFANGVVWPDEAPFPPIPPPPNDDRGWWSSRFVTRMLFYDPADLAAVAKGRKKPHEAQPYATLDLDGNLFTARTPQQKHCVRACAFDRERGLLYVTEFRADGDKSLVHVWRVKP